MSISKKTALILFFSTVTVRLIVAALMWPGADEAYYYTYGLHPAAGYFDHPPLVAAAGGIIPGLTGWVSPLSIRLVPIMLFSLAVFFFFKLSRALLDRAEAFTAVSVFMVVPMFFFSGTFLLPDAGLIFFWTAGLYMFRKTMERPSPVNWLLLGTVTGLGMLSKYTMVLLPAGAFLFLVINREYRKLLLTPWPYVALALAAALFSPVLMWNANHRFVSFSFQAGRVGISGLKPMYLCQSLAGQAAYLMPWIFFPALYFAGRSILRWKDRFNSFLFAFGAVPVFLFMGSSLFHRVLPHWPVIGYITLTLAAGRYYHGLLLRRKSLFNFGAILHLVLVGGVILAVLLQVKTGLLINRGLPSSGIEPRKGIKDISMDIVGWDELAAYLEKNFDPQTEFIFTHEWPLGGEISFALRGRYPVLCLGGKGEARGFSIWQDQEECLGKDGLMIVTSDSCKNPEKYSPYFESIGLEQKIPVWRSGKLVKIVYVYRCRSFKKTFPCS
jgi:hypothetical protein